MQDSMCMIKPWPMWLPTLKISATGTQRWWPRGQEQVELEVDVAAAEDPTTAKEEDK